MVMSETEIPGSGGVPSDRDGAIEVILVTLNAANEAATKANAYVAELRDVLKQHLLNKGRKKYEFNDGEHILTGQIVTVAPINVDFDKMIADKVLTESEISLFTERKYSKPLFEKAVDSGEIGAAKITKYLSRSEETQNVRFVPKPVPGNGSD